MRKRSLEILLSRLADVPSPRSDLEQYRTPPGIVAEMVILAASDGGIEGRNVVDLGCGGAPFLIAAGVLGAKVLVGIDIDPECLRVARENLERTDASLGTDLMERTQLIEGDVSEFRPEERFDTVFMNPPFGAQKRGADRPFLDAAVSTGAKVYSLHNAKGLAFVRDHLVSRGYRILSEEVYRFPVPHRFAFHTRESFDVDVAMLKSAPAKGTVSAGRPAMTNVK